MAYHIYKTDGLIIGGYDRSEAGRALYILTREYGLILATAQSVRALKSKLRYGLQNLSRSHVDLVKGKGGWRIVNARSGENFFECEGASVQEKRIAMARIAKLLRRLMKGEERNEKLFDEVVHALSFIRETPLSKKELFSAEVITVMKILFLLGYWGEHDTLTPFVSEEKLSTRGIEEMQKVRPLAIREINKSLKETQL